ncbi:uncharacterized protein [Rutidosis leptorrhynchoides]|uniref:uncharacterized protein n=1 Tax=Rutidosis leptorrhynchoides TaxID=125765 RepID=UPI003A993A1B
MATDSNHDLPSPSSSIINRRYCFCIPYTWQKVRSSDYNYSEQKTIWSRGVTALKKLREWSEIVAGPRWKNFIRRFNRNKSFGNKSSQFQYDPLGYALNFDEGPYETGDSDLENEYMIRNFSSRYALRTKISANSKTTSDSIGPNFV